MPNYHYNRETFASAVAAVGLERGSLVFSHNNIGFFGIPEGEKTIENSFRTILDAFLDVIGPEGTLVVPTFTYSFPKGYSFDPDNTPSDCGYFTEMLRKLPEAFRSEDPCVSVAAIGRRAEEMTHDVPENSYGKNSFFERFYNAGGVVCNMNFDAGSTFVHYVERRLRVSYRFDKTFSGMFCKGGECVERKSTIWVRLLTEGTEARFELFDKIAREKGLFRTVSVGRGCVGLITASDTFELIRDTLPSMPWFLTEAGIKGFVPDLENAKR